MKIRSGTTRVVIILDNFVIKFPKVPIIEFFVRLIKHSRDNNVKNKIEQHNINFVYIMRYFLKGFIASFIEWRYSKENPDKEGIIPIYFAFMFGLVLIQPRGEVFPENNRKYRKVIKDAFKKKLTDTDMFYRHNYSLWRGKICLHDYGSMLTISNLQYI